MKAFLLKLAAIIVQHKLVVGIVAAAVVAGGVTTGVVVHNNNVKNNDVVVAEHETKETKEKETTKKTISLESLKVALKDETNVFYTDSAITNDLFTVIGVYSDKSEKELTEFTIAPVELVVGENIVNFVVKDNGKDVSVDFAINVVDKPTEAQPNKEYNNEYSNVNNQGYTENNNQEDNNLILGRFDGHDRVDFSRGYIFNINDYEFDTVNAFGQNVKAITKDAYFIYYDQSLSNNVISEYCEPDNFFLPDLIEIGNYFGLTYIGQGNTYLGVYHIFEGNGHKYTGSQHNGLGEHGEKFVDVSFTDVVYFPYVNMEMNH